jgi:membrane fusion protein (multidrug efflux system)
MARVAAGTVAAVLLALALAHMAASMAYVATDDAYIEGRIHTISPKVPGRLLKVYPADNQKVEKGEILAEIDPADHEVKVKEAQAAVAAAEARVAEAQAAIKGAEAALGVESAALKQAGIDRARARRLYAQGVLPKEKLERAGTAYDLARARFAAGRQGVAQAIAARRLQESLLGVQRTALEAADLALSYTRIISPADGYVAKKSAEDGNMVQSGQPLMAVVALDDIWVLANYKETQLAGVRPGQSVRFKVDTFPKREFTGRVDSIMAGTGAAFSLFPPENALGNYVKVVQRIPVKIVLQKGADPEHLLRVGMSVVAKIKVRQ